LLVNSALGVIMSLLHPYEGQHKQISNQAGEYRNLPEW
jgi:hypothetical protein